MEELWVVFVFICRKWGYATGERKTNKLVEWKALVDTVEIKSAHLKDSFLL